MAKLLTAEEIRTQAKIIFDSEINAAIEEINDKLLKSVHGHPNGFIEYTASHSKLAETLKAILEENGFTVDYATEYNCRENYTSSTRLNIFFSTK